MIQNRPKSRPFKFKVSPAMFIPANHIISIVTKRKRYTKERKRERKEKEKADKGVPVAMKHQEAGGVYPNSPLAATAIVNI